MKKWYLSKTIWVNLISMVALMVQTVIGKEIISLEVQGIILTCVNMVLRLITKHELV